MVPIINVIEDVETRVAAMQNRESSQVGHVEKRKHVARNSSVIAGTRIPTAAIRRFREAGYSKEQILKQYPTLSIEDVDGALEYEEGLCAERGNWP